MLAYWSCFSGVVSTEISWIQTHFWATRAREGCSACAGEVLMTQGSDMVWWVLCNTAHLWVPAFVAVFLGSFLSSTQSPLWKFSWISTGLSSLPSQCSVCWDVGHSNDIPTSSCSSLLLSACLPCLLWNHCFLNHWDNAEKPLWWGAASFGIQKTCMPSLSTLSYFCSPFSLCWVRREL